MCGVVFFVGPTTRGLANWQEAQRALAAREMQQRGDWIVPTIDGRPYLNKPPLFYWVQLAIAGVRGAELGELDLRLAVALCGWAGVLATYLLAKRLLAPGPGEDAEYPRRAALWAALFLATGVLYVRSSRIGELDIAIVPFAVGAIAAVHAAWRAHLHRGRTSWLAVGVAALCASGAMLAKGPPALLAVALGAYGGIALWAAIGAAWEEEPDGAGDGRASGGAALRALAGYVVGAVVFMAAGIWSSWSVTRWPDRLSGLVLLDPMGGFVGAMIGALCSRRAIGAAWGAFSRTHPLVVLGVPALALWAWLAAARSRIGEGPVAGTIRGEAAGNVRPFLLEAPLNNVEAAAYGVGVGSAAALMACVWLARSRPRLTPGLSIIAAWTALNLVAFSVLGKGVPRYLTPVWPAIAMLGGAWFAWRPSGRPRPAAVRVSVGAAVVALAAGQAWWYGLRGAEQTHSPRELIAELMASPLSVDPARLATFEFDTPQVDFYAGERVESFVDTVPRPGLAGVGPRTIDDLRGLVESGPYTVLIRAAQPSFLDAEPAAERLRAAGLRVEPITTRASWRIDNDRTDVVAVRVAR